MRRCPGSEEIVGGVYRRSGSFDIQEEGPLDHLGKVCRDRFWHAETLPSMEALVDLPWLDQRQAYQVGYYLLTHGLQTHARHLELELCNVPGAMLPAAMRLLNTLAEYVLNSGKQLGDGQTLQLGGDYEAVLAFREIAPGSDPKLPHERPVLRVLFVC